MDPAPDFQKRIVELGAALQLQKIFFDEDAGVLEIMDALHLLVKPLLHFQFQRTQVESPSETVVVRLGTLPKSVSRSTEKLIWRFCRAADSRTRGAP
jgi:hypothetical protein